MGFSFIAAAIAATNLTAELPPIRIEASRLEVASSAMAAQVQTLTRGEIAASGSHDVVDLLSKRMPSLHVRRLGGSNPALAEFSMRGFGESGYGRVAILVDGERLGSPDMNRPDLSRVALGSVSRIEVLGGPQCVLYGDGTSAGLINIVTDPQDYTPRTYLEAYGGSWNSIGSSFGTRGGFAAEGVRYQADAAWDRSDGYRDHSAFESWNFNGGITKDWVNGSFLRVSTFYNDSQYDLPGALSLEEWRHDARASHADEDRYHRSTYGGNAVLKLRLNDENALKFSGNFSSRKMWAYQRGEGWFSDNEYDIYSYRILTEWLNESELFGFRQELVVGAQYTADLLDGIQRSSYSYQKPNYERETMDFYAQDTLHITDIFALQYGGRYSRVWSYNSLCERSHRTDDLSAFEVALLLTPTDRSKLYLKWSRIYRNPFLDETPGRFDAGYNWVNTRILDPERGWSAEIGGEWRVCDEFSVGADAYYTVLENEIFYDAINYNNVNYDDNTCRRGFDVYANWERDHVAGLSVAASYVKADFDGGDFDGKVVPLVPEITASVNGRFWLWYDCYVFGGYRYQGESYSCSDFDNVFEKLDWFGLFHVGLTYEPTEIAFLEGWRLTVTIDNLFDKRYCDYSTYGSQYYPGVGRCAMVSLRYEF